MLSAVTLAASSKEAPAFCHVEGARMCIHRDGDPEDCVLRGDMTSDRLVCVQHPAPIPRQRDDDIDVRVAEMQRWSGYSPEPSPTPRPAPPKGRAAASDPFGVS